MKFVIFKVIIHYFSSLLPVLLIVFAMHSRNRLYQKETIRHAYIDHSGTRYLTGEQFDKLQLMFTVSRTIIAVRTIRCRGFKFLARPGILISPFAKGSCIGVIDQVTRGSKMQIIGEICVALLIEIN